MAINQLLHKKSILECEESELSTHNKEVEENEKSMFSTNKAYVVKVVKHNGVSHELIKDYEDYNNLVQCLDCKNGVDFYEFTDIIKLIKVYGQGYTTVSGTYELNLTSLYFKEVKEVEKLSKELEELEDSTEVERVLKSEWASR